MAEEARRGESVGDEPPASVFAHEHAGRDEQVACDEAEFMHHGRADRGGLTQAARYWQGQSDNHDEPLHATPRPSMFVRWLAGQPL